MKTVLFVSYGGGHVRMVIPVARELMRLGIARPVVLALTTAADIARQAGLEVLQFRDFIDSTDTQALEYGRQLIQTLSGDVVDPEESRAYMGMSYADLVHEVGEQEASSRFARQGRQAFLPVRTLARILGRLRPALVVVTSSPRAERAAVLAAREASIPAVCMVDLFAIDEIAWIGAPRYADRLCVLNEAVRQSLVRAGRLDSEIVVTGNPAFDALFASEVIRSGRELRTRMGWQGRQVILWASQIEPAINPFNGLPGDPAFPAKVLAELVRLVQSHPDWVLCVRPRPGEARPQFPEHSRILLTGQDQPLHPLLHACDLVISLSSTVGLEGKLAGARVVQVLGSVFDYATPLGEYGIADEAVPLARLGSAMTRCLDLGRRDVSGQTGSAERVVGVLRPFLGE